MYEIDNKVYIVNEQDGENLAGPIFSRFSRMLTAMLMGDDFYHQINFDLSVATIINLNVTAPPSPQEFVMQPLRPGVLVTLIDPSELVPGPNGELVAHTDMKISIQMGIFTYDSWDHRFPLLTYVVDCRSPEGQEVIHSGDIFEFQDTSDKGCEEDEVDIGEHLNEFLLTAFYRFKTGQWPPGSIERGKAQVSARH